MVCSSGTISSWTNRRICSPSRRSSSGRVKPGNTVMVAWLLENPEACLAARRPCQAGSIAPMAHLEQSATLGEEPGYYLLDAPVTGLSGSGRLRALDARRALRGRILELPGRSARRRRSAGSLRPRRVESVQEQEDDDGHLPPAHSPSDAYDRDVVGGQPGGHLRPSERIPL